MSGFYHIVEIECAGISLRFYNIQDKKFLLLFEFRKRFGYSSHLFLIKQTTLELLGTRLT